MPCHELGTTKLGRFGMESTFKGLVERPSNLTGNRA